MKASELPIIPGAPHFLVRGPYSWGRGPTVDLAIKEARVGHMAMVHVSRVDDKASCDSINGSLRFNVRGDIWEGRVTGPAKCKDVTLKRVTHPMRNPDGTP